MTTIVAPRRQNEGNSIHEWEYNMCCNNEETHSENLITDLS